MKIVKYTGFLEKVQMVHYEENCTNCSFNVRRVFQKPVVQHVVQKSQSTPRQSTPHIDLTKDDGEDFTKDVELDWTKGYFQKSGEQLNSSITQAPSSISGKKDYHCKVKRGCTCAERLD